MAEEQRKAALTDALARSRSEITTQVDLLRHDLDFPARARRSFARHPAIWVGGTVLAGLVLSRVLWPKKKDTAPRHTHTRSKEPEIEKVGQAGLALGALKIVFDIARPVLIPWATRLVAERFGPGKNRGSTSR